MGVLRGLKVCVLGDNAEKFVDKVNLFGGIASTSLGMDTDFLIICATDPPHLKYQTRADRFLERRKLQIEIAAEQHLDLSDGFLPVLDSEYIAHACLFHNFPDSQDSYSLIDKEGDAQGPKFQPLDIPELSVECIRDRLMLVLSSNNPDDWRQVLYCFKALSLSYAADRQENIKGKCDIHQVCQIYVKNEVHIIFWCETTVCFSLTPVHAAGGNRKKKNRVSMRRYTVYFHAEH